MPDLVGALEAALQHNAALLGVECGQPDSLALGFDLVEEIFHGFATGCVPAFAVRGVRHIFVQQLLQLANQVLLKPFIIRSAHPLLVRPTDPRVLVEVEKQLQAARKQRTAV